MKSVPTKELINIPAKTAIPREILLAAPAPVEITSGNVHKIKAKEVIKIGRKRTRPPSRAASVMDLPEA